jgi:hypothetical protein
MVMSFSVTTLTAPKATLKETRYSSIEEAITGAESMLGDGAGSVWIVDRIAQTGWIASSQPRLELIGTGRRPYHSSPIGISPQQA